MHPLIDSSVVETIRSTGNTNSSLPDRAEVMDSYGLPYDRKAENVIITGCQILAALPQVLSKLTQIFDFGKLSYTFLSKEYCCGNYLYRPGIKAKDEDALAQCRSLSKEFVGLNLNRARELGAKRLIIFCSPCYPIYKYAYPDENIVFYTHAMNETLESLTFNKEIDYYAGCYRLHKKIADVPIDLESTNEIFSKINGLTVNRIKAPSCCYKPEGLSYMLDNIITNTMVHICTGCYYQALLYAPKDKNVEILMLPELVDMALKT